MSELRIRLDETRSRLAPQEGAERRFAERVAHRHADRVTALAVTALLLVGLFGVGTLAGSGGPVGDQPLAFVQGARLVGLASGGSAPLPASDAVTIALFGVGFLLVAAIALGFWLLITPPRQRISAQT